MIDYAFFTVLPGGDNYCGQVFYVPCSLWSHLIVLSCPISTLVCQFPNFSSSIPSSVCYLFSCYLWFVSFFPLPSPESPQRLLLNSLPVFKVWKGKADYNKTHLIWFTAYVLVSVRVTSPFQSLRVTTHLSHLRHETPKRFSQRVEFGPLVPLSPQHIRQGCSSWAADELYSMEITSQLIL